MRRGSAGRRAELEGPDSVVLSTYDILRRPTVVPEACVRRRSCTDAEDLEVSLCADLHAAPAVRRVARVFNPGSAPLILIFNLLIKHALDD